MCKALFSYGAECWAMTVEDKRKLRITELRMLVVVVVVQFLSGIVPLAEMARFALVLPELLALHFSTLLDSGHPSSSNQFSLSLFPFLTSLLWLFSLSLATHFKIQSHSQNTIVIPSQHMSVPFNLICCC